MPTACIYFLLSYVTLHFLLGDGHGSSFIYHLLLTRWIHSAGQASLGFLLLLRVTFWGLVD